MVIEGAATCLNCDKRANVFLEQFVTRFGLGFSDSDLLFLFAVSVLLFSKPMTISFIFSEAPLDDSRPKVVKLEGFEDVASDDDGVDEIDDKANEEDFSGVNFAGESAFGSF